MTTSPLSPDEIRAAAAAHAELGPQYHDAVVESFLAKIDRQIDARVDARLSDRARIKRHRSAEASPETTRGYRAGLISGMALGLFAAGVPLSLLALHLSDLAYVNSRGDLLLSWLATAVISASGAVVLARIWHRRRLARTHAAAARQRRVES